MKLVKMAKHTIMVDFHGVELIVPVAFSGGWLAMDKAGNVFAMNNRPEYCKESDYWTCRNWGSNSCHIAVVESDMKVKDSLVLIKSK